MYKILKILSFIFFSLLFLHKVAHPSDKIIKIGLLVPLTGDDKKIGEQIIKSTRIALKDIGNNKIEIYLKDTNSNPNQTIKSSY